jgi:hypothetical protein
MCISHLVWKDPYYPNATIQQISLTLLSASLSDLCGETSLDGRDTSSRTAGIASNEVQSVLSLVKFRIWRSTGFAGDIFH